MRSAARTTSFTRWRSSRTCRSRIWRPLIRRRGAPRTSSVSPPGGGDVYIYPFGAVVFRDVPAAERDAELARLRRARPGLTSATVIEELQRPRGSGQQGDVVGGRLTLDKLTPARASVIALTVAQSAAMEYYERIVEEMFARTGQIVERLEAQRHGPVADAPAAQVHRRRDQDAQRGAHDPAPARQARRGLGRPGDGPHLRRAARRVRPGRPVSGAGAEAAQRPGGAGAGSRRGARSAPGAAGSRDRRC